MARIKKDCLVKKTTLEKAELEHLIEDEKLGPKPIPFEVSHDHWVLFKSEIMEGDELWEYIIPPQGFWDSQGLCIVRNAKIVRSIETDNLSAYEPEDGIFTIPISEELEDDDWDMIQAQVFMGNISNDWLRRKTTLEKAEQDNRLLHDDNSWLQFKSQMQEGDELWKFRNSKKCWDNLAGREGFCIVRDGEIVADFLTKWN